MPANEQKVLNRLLVSGDSEYREFARARLRELGLIPIRGNGYDELPNLHKHAEAGTLDTVPVELLTLSNLRTLGKNGESVFHVAAEHGNLGQLPRELVSKENMGLRAGEAGNVFHWAAMYGGLFLLPPDLLTEKTLLEVNEPAEGCDWLVCQFRHAKIVKNASVLHLAALNHHLGQVPKHLITERGLLQFSGSGYNVLHVAASTGQFDQIPEHILTTKCMRSRTMPGGYPPLHLAARYGNLDKIPSRFLTTENLMYLDSTRSVFHTAAEFGHLDQLPKVLLTEDVIMTSHNGFSVLQMAATHGHLHQIPNMLLTEQNLCWKADNASGSALEISSVTGHLDHLLGLEFSPAICNQISESWYLKNLEVCNAIKQARGTLCTDLDAGVELF